MVAEPSPIIQLAPEDNVAAAARDLAAGETFCVAGRTIRVAEPVPLGHKIAVAAIAAGQKVLKYALPIGSATRTIAAGEYVHTHNLKSDYLPTFAAGAGG